MQANPDQLAMLTSLAESTAKMIAAERAKDAQASDPQVIDAFCQGLFEQLMCVPPDLWGKGIEVSLTSAAREKLSDSEKLELVSSLSHQVLRGVQPLKAALLLQLARCAWDLQVERTRLATMQLPPPDATRQ